MNIFLRGGGDYNPNSNYTSGKNTAKVREGKGRWKEIGMMAQLLLGDGRSRSN